MVPLSVVSTFYKGHIKSIIIGHVDSILTYSSVFVYYSTFQSLALSKVNMEQPAQHQVQLGLKFLLDSVLSL